MPFRIRDSVRYQPRYYLNPEAQIGLDVSSPAEAAPLAAPATLTNLSRGGVGLLLQDPLPVGQSVQIVLHDDQSALRVTIRAMVRWCRPAEPTGWKIGCRAADRLAPEELGELFLHGVLLWDAPSAAQDQ